MRNLQLVAEETDRRGQSSYTVRLSIEALKWLRDKFKYPVDYRYSDTDFTVIVTDRTMTALTLRWFTNLENIG